MDAFHIDARKWRFLNNPQRYVDQQLKQEDINEENRFQPEPLARQFRTAKEILLRFMRGHGVLLADDVGLGKTTVGALVAWAVALQGKRVRIYAPNEVLLRRWAEELERHVPMLLQAGASKDCIKSRDVGALKAGCIQVATHHTFVRSQLNNEQRGACDLMIIDEAHRAKGDGSAFKQALTLLGKQAARKLILTATPLSIRVSELEQLLRFVGASDFDAVSRYANDLKRLYTLGDGHDLAVETKRLEDAARAAVDTLQPYLIRHAIEDLPKAEKDYFGKVDDDRWNITTATASEEDLKLLLRMDRLLRLSPERKGERRNDPRFHIGWQHVSTELERIRKRVGQAPDRVTRHHIEAAQAALATRRTHPKIEAVSAAIQPLLRGGEKVLVFCHHRATASELLQALESLPGLGAALRRGPTENVWRAAWEGILTEQDRLVTPIIDWLCTPGLRSQVAGWIGNPASSPQALSEQLRTIRPRNGSANVPTIAEAGKTLVTSLLHVRSTSTRALLKNIAKGAHTFGGRTSHFPGYLDEGLRVMGSWVHDAHAEAPKTLYTGKPDVVIAMFNSPFGPDVLVTTDRLSEGVDLHRWCRHLIHYELDPSPVRTLQRNGRVRRVGSWAALTGRPVRYAYPIFGGTRDEKAVGVMKQRIEAFALLLGGVPMLNDDLTDSDQCFANTVLTRARKKLNSFNRKLAMKSSES